MSDNDDSDDDINVTEILIGIQNSGKSWYGLDRGARLADEYDCPFVLHDAGSAAIRKKHNPYHNCDWKSYKERIPPATLQLFRPDIVVVNTAYAEDAILYADFVRRKKEVVVMIDEISAAQEVSPGHIGEPWRSRIAQRRAFKTALIICMQTPTMASRFMTGTSTSVKCFRVEHEDDLKALVKLKFPPDAISKIPHLKQGEFIELVKGFGSD